MLYLVDNTEDVSLGHSLSGDWGSEEATGGGAGYTGVFATRPGSCYIKRLLLIKENWISSSVLFYQGKDARVWACWNHPLICTSALWGRCPVFSHPESPQGVPRWGSSSGWGLASRQAACLSPSRVPSGLAFGELECDDGLMTAASFAWQRHFSFTPWQSVWKTLPMRSTLRFG